MPAGKGYGDKGGSKEMFEKALKDGLITKGQMNNLHPNLVTAIIKKKRGSGGMKKKPAGGKKGKKK